MCVFEDVWQAKRDFSWKIRLAEGVKASVRDVICEGTLNSLRKERAGKGETLYLVFL